MFWLQGSAQWLSECSQGHLKSCTRDVRPKPLKVLSLNLQIQPEAQVAVVLAEVEIPPSESQTGFGWISPIFA